MRAIVRLDEDNLVLVSVVQRPRLVFLDGEVEEGLVRLHLSYEVGVLSVVSSDDVRPPKAELWVGSSWQEHGDVGD